MSLTGNPAYDEMAEPVLALVRSQSADELNAAVEMAKQRAGGDQRRGELGMLLLLAAMVGDEATARGLLIRLASKQPSPREESAPAGRVVPIRRGR